MKKYKGRGATETARAKACNIMGKPERLLRMGKKKTKSA
jgi:hypothetical protein